MNYNATTATTDTTTASTTTTTLLMLLLTTSQVSLFTCMQEVLVRQETWLKVSRPGNIAKFGFISTEYSLACRAGLNCRKEAIMSGVFRSEALPSKVGNSFIPKNSVIYTSYRWYSTTTARHMT